MKRNKKHEPFEHESYDSDDVKRKNEGEFLAVATGFIAFFNLFGGIIMRSDELIVVGGVALLLTLIIEIWRK